MISNEELIQKAGAITKPKKMRHGFTTSDCGSAILTDKGNVYLGVSIDTVSSMGFCSEHAAIANMVTNGEYVIKKCVAVIADGTIVAPCGRCREFMYQINDKNLEADIIVGEGKIMKLRDLLPEPWDKDLS